MVAMKKGKLLLFFGAQSLLLFVKVALKVLGLQKLSDDSRLKGDWSKTKGCSKKNDT